MRTCRTLLIYCVSFIGCFAASITLDLACGGETDPYDYYVSFFNNTLQGQKEYKPFYFTSWNFVYDEEEPASEADINAEEWADYLGKDVNAKDVERAMYHLSPKTDADLQEGYLKTGEKLPDTLAGNSFLKALQIKKNPIALKYYRFAKSVEPVANFAYDRWEPKPIDTIGLVNAGKVALRVAGTEKDKFIQLRYFYQAQRLLHYGGHYREAMNVYDNYTVGIASPSHIKGWAMALKAGELRRLKDTVQSAYLFSKVFAQYPERRLQAYRNYKYMDVKTPQVLALAKDNTERAVIYAIDGFGNPALNFEALEKVYAYEPTSPMVGVLLVREVNKLEETYLTKKLLSKSKLIGSNYYAGESDKKDVEYLNHMNQLRGFCKMLVTQHKYPDYNIGNLAAAYIDWMQGDNADGFTYLRNLNVEKLSPAMDDQKQIIQLLLSSQNIQKLNEVNEPQLLPALKWLDEKVKAERKQVKSNSDFAFQDNHKFTSTASNFYEQVLAPAYLRQGDTVKAALVLLKSPGQYTRAGFWSNNLHSTQVARIIRWRKTPPTIPYLSFLTDKLNGISLNDLYDMQGTALLREHQYAKAIPIFKLIDANYLNKDPEDYYKADPFVDRINDYPKVRRYGKTKGYNKLQFATAMTELEQKIKTDAPNAASYFYRYATGLYNTSFYGNAPYLINADGDGEGFGRENVYSYDVDHMRTSNAKKYFLQARELSFNEEFKAKCTFMIAKCRQKEFVMPGYNWPNYAEEDKLYHQNLVKNDYFDELRSQYKKTAFYKKAVGECTYLKDFILTTNK